MSRILEALNHWQRKKKEYDKASSDCDGSWGYYGHSLSMELEAAENEFTAALDEVIDARSVARRGDSKSDDLEELFEIVRSHHRKIAKLDARIPRDQ